MRQSIFDDFEDHFIENDPFVSEKCFWLALGVVDFAAAVPKIGAPSTACYFAYKGTTE
jgi:hypothetical protein